MVKFIAYQAVSSVVIGKKTHTRFVGRSGRWFEALRRILERETTRRTRRGVAGDLLLTGRAVHRSRIVSQKGSIKTGVFSVVAKGVCRYWSSRGSGVSEVPTSVGSLATKHPTKVGTPNAAVAATQTQQLIESRDQTRHTPSVSLILPSSASRSSGLLKTSVQPAARASALTS